MKSKKVFALMLVWSGMVAGCQWVKPSQEAHAVALVKPGVVSQCKPMGRTTSSSKHKIGFIKRGDSKVTEELITLAKNEAAAVGGDTIVADGSRKEGKQAFLIYKCR